MAFFPDSTAALCASASLFFSSASFLCSSAIPWCFIFSAIKNLIHSATGALPVVHSRIPFAAVPTVTSSIFVGWFQNASFSGNRSVHDHPADVNVVVWIPYPNDRALPVPEENLLLKNSPLCRSRPVSIRANTLIAGKDCTSTFGCWRPTVGRSFV